MEKKIKINETIFIVAYALIIMSNMFVNVEIIGNYIRVLEIIGLTLLGINCISQAKKYKFYTIAIIILILSELILLYKVDSSRFIIDLFLIVLASKNIQITQVISKIFKIQVVFIFLILILHFCGYTNDLIMYREDGTIRNSMGFSHPNAFGAYILALCFEYVYLKKGNVKFVAIIIMSILAFVINYYSDSRAALLSFILIIILTQCYKIFKGKIIANRFIKFIISYSFIILTIVSLGLIYCYDNNYYFANILNQFTTGRVRLMSESLNLYGFTLSGNYVTKNLDNSYIQIIVRYGILVYLTLGYLFIKTFKELYKNKEYLIIILLAIFMIYGMMESYLFKVAYNIFLIYFGNIIFKKREIN